MVNVIRRGEIWWAELGAPVGSEPGYRRPVLVIQRDRYNSTDLPTVICLSFTTNLARSHAAGHVHFTAAETGLPKDSLLNVTQIITVNKRFLTDQVGLLDPELMFAIDNMLRNVLDL